MTDITLLSPPQEPAKPPLYGCLLQHRQLLMCRRGTLGAKLETNLSHGNKVDCIMYKIKLVDALLGTLCRFNPNATLNCLTNDQICKIIQQCYIILPEEC